MLSFVKKAIKYIIQKLRLYKMWYEIKSYLACFNSVPQRINEREVIISLASWKARYRFLVPTLESLSRQRFKVDRILLWLDEEDQGNIPDDIMAYQHKGIDIRFTKNIGSYKKLIPTLKEFPDAVIITVDDDVIYPTSLVSRLYRSYCKYPDKIHANRCRHLKRNKNRTWEFYQHSSIVRDRQEKLHTDLLFTGVGGVLYPGRASFHSDVFDSTLFLDFAPKQDDVWFWYMARLANVDICKVKNHFVPNNFNMVKGTEESSLWLMHNRNQGSSCISSNNIALEKIRKYYEEQE